MQPKAGPSPYSPSPETLSARPGHPGQSRLRRDKDSCATLHAQSVAEEDFFATLAENCDTAVSDLTNPKTSPDVFDLARAYLDSLHDVAERLRSSELFNDAHPSDASAFLILRDTKFSSRETEWRDARADTPTGQTTRNAQSHQEKTNADPISSNLIEQA